MNIHVKAALLAIGLTTVSACAAVGVDQYAGNKPSLVAERFFDGRLNAHGIVKNRSGVVIRYFSASIDAYWVNGIGTLDERFVFDDGEQQTRVWQLTPSGNGTYIATARDVVGEATMKVVGNSLFLDYVLRIPHGDGTIDLRIDDRMYLVTEQVLLNESVMSKWGLDVGQLTLVITKE